MIGLNTSVNTLPSNVLKKTAIGVSAFDICYPSVTSGVLCYEACIADNAGKMPCVAIALENIIAGGSGRFATTPQVITNPAWAFSAVNIGKLVYAKPPLVRVGTPTVPDGNSGLITFVDESETFQTHGVLDNEILELSGPMGDYYERVIQRVNNETTLRMLAVLPTIPLGGGWWYRVVSTYNAGDVTTEQPYVVGNIVQSIGYVTSENSIMFIPSLVSTTVAE